MLWQDGERAFCRGWREDAAGNRNPVLVVVPASEHPSPSCLARLEHEYSLREALDSAWAARPLELIRQDGRTLLVLEDGGGVPLERFVGAPMELGAFLQLALRITAALGKLHEHGLLHKDVKPTNLLMNRATGEIKLTGFGIASRLQRERHAPEPPETIAGSLAYMAPEQTGRMNRSIDSRSDLYALGVTLYQLLTGSLPFTASDPMEWIHSHIARNPPPPGERVEHVPAPVSRMILKLLAKVAEERYQTALGLEHDLRRCVMEWELRRYIEDFAPGQHDTPDRLLVPEKLYGREQEVQRLLGAFERIIASGVPELVLISGYSGIGKSSVVNELHKLLVPARGLFAAGKFDRQRRDVPYATLIQALQVLVRALLTKTDVQLASWRRALTEALGVNAGLMVDLVPELRLIIGEPPAVPELGPQQAQGRFRLVFRRFVGVFARAEHPLVLFLDDLQWLDTATLELLEDLLTRSDLHHLMLVGAFRDNEVDASHPLTRKLAAIAQCGGKIMQMTLEALSPGHVEELISDALRTEPARVAPLARLVQEKTAGNPFFVIQFLSVLAQEGLLSFDHSRARWSWDLNRIEAKGYTDNVVDLIAGKLTRLPYETRKALQQLACLGNEAETAMLSVTLGVAEGEVHAALWPAVRQDVVEPLERSYRFTHDRVQEAAYSLIPQALSAEAHLRIGRLLAAHTEPAHREEEIFNIVNQLNRGAALITSPAEREQLAALNLVAGRRARDAAAYASALTYLVPGAALLPQDCWERLHELAFALELNRAECEFLTGERAAAEDRLIALRARAATTLERATVARLLVDLNVALDRSDAAIAIGLDYLRGLGFDWSAHPTPEQARLAYERIWTQLGERTIEQLTELPLMSDPVSLATLDVLTRLAVPALYTDANLLTLVACTAVSLSLERGNSDNSCYAYVTLATVIGPHFGHYKAGFRFGWLGLQLVEQHGLRRFRARIYLLFGDFIIPWTQHVRSGRELIRRAFDAANQSGEPAFAAAACNHLCTNMLAAGDPLPEVQRVAEDGLAFSQKIQVGMAVDVIVTQLALIRMLRGHKGGFGPSLEGAFDERALELHFFRNPELALAECWYWIRKLQARYFAGDMADALDCSVKAQRLLWTSPSEFETAEYHFFSALAAAAHHAAASPEQRAALVEGLCAHHRQLQDWAGNCPENFENRAALVGAEIARIEGRTLEAQRLYEQAIRSAQANGFVHNEAVANEVAARFHAAEGLEQIARFYRRNARHCYLRWGAEAKVRQLEELDPHLRSEYPVPGPTSTIGTPVEHLDLATVMKVSQALSGEIVLERLLDTLLRTALEQAGAQRGLLVLSRGGEPRVEAEATTEGDRIRVELRDAPASAAVLPESVLHYALRTRESVIIDDARAENAFPADPYIQWRRARSILCLPLVAQAKLIGALYLENNLAPRVFAPARTAVLKLIASQAAIALENSRLYRDLAQREAKIRRLVDANIIGIFIFDVDGRILEANDAFLNIVGYDREDLLCGRLRWTDLTPPEWLERDASEWLPELKSSGSLQPYEKEYFRKDGTRVPVCLGAAQFEAGGNEGVAFVLELTERRKAEAERQALQVAESANRAKSEFLATMSHELRTPLNGILGYAQILRLDPSLGQRHRAAVKIIQQSGEQLLTLVNDVLDLAKIEAERLELHPVEFSLPEFLRGIVDLIGVSARQKGLRFITDWGARLPARVRADEQYLRRVLLNLLSNAIKFTDVGAVTLRVRYLSGERLRFEVRDTGIGLRKEERQRIFEPFEQATDPSRRVGGTGLGLTISRRLVERMGGELRLKSRFGKGSTFSFELHAPELHPVREPTVGGSMSGYEGPRRRVLVADDEIVSRTVLSDWLRSLGFDVVEAVDGEGAVAKATDLQPDLILMDLRMPQVDGLEAIQRLRRAPGLREVPVIAVSASASEREAQRSRAAGANALLSKPLDFKRLQGMLGELLEIRWIYAPVGESGDEAGAPEVLTPPPAAEMDVLYGLAQQGCMSDIARHAARIASLDERYQPFARELQRLARAYQSQAVLKLIEKHREAVAPN
jgi:PAS domain S-box-containing protein